MTRSGGGGLGGERSGRAGSSQPVVMFLTTGRCGTQWLTAGLREAHPELEAEHEPIGPLYAPRRHFRAYDAPEGVLDEPAVRDHVARIEGSRRTYVETGWPLFPVLPLLARRMPERLRVVHLFRHPVPTALSHLAHSSYAGSPRDDPFTQLATLGPSDPHVLHPEYASRWTGLTPYEKCLYWWTEVNEFGLEFAEREPQIPLLRISAEDLLSGEGETLPCLLDFIGVSFDPSWRDRLEMVVDRWHHHTEQMADPHLVLRHPATVAVAGRLGYDVSAVDPDALRARYEGAPDPGEDRIGRYVV